MDEAELWEFWLIGGLRVGHVEYDRVKAASMNCLFGRTYPTSFLNTSTSNYFYIRTQKHKSTPPDVGSSSFNGITTSIFRIVQRPHETSVHYVSKNSQTR